MALTRARAVAGDAAFLARVEREVEAVISRRRGTAELARDALKMRALIEEEKPPRDVWDLKLIPGGLIDLEFIAQVAMLSGKVRAQGEDGARPTGTAETLSRLSPDFAGPQVVQELFSSHSLYSTLTQIIRLCLTGPLDPDDIPPGLVDLLLRNTDLPELGVLEAHVKETSRQVRKDFELLLRGKRT
jgi:glutamate-ammonia-ligase adenylyltransferase